jgi:hypothetical protein
MTSLYLPDVEARPQPGVYRALIDAARSRGTECSNITASGVPQMSADAHRQQGRMLAERGYARD